MQTENGFILGNIQLEKARLQASKRTDDLRFARMLARIGPEIDAIEQRRSQRKLREELKNRKFRRAILLTGLCFLGATAGVVAGLGLYLGEHDGLYTRIVRAYQVIVDGERTHNAKSVPALRSPAPEPPPELALMTPAPLEVAKVGSPVALPETPFGYSATKSMQEKSPVQAKHPQTVLPVPVIQKQEVAQEKLQPESAVDVVLNTKPRPSPPPPAPVPLNVQATAPKSTNESVPFEVTAYLDGYLMVRQGAKVFAIQVGQKLPDGRVLMSVSSTGYKAEKN
jgi:hypothetical protein